MVRHSPLYLHKPLYKPTYYGAPSLVSRRVHRHLYFNTPSPFSLATGFNTSLNTFDVKRSPAAHLPVASPITLDSTLSMTPKGMNFRRFMWNEMDETMEDLIQGVANGADVMKHIFVNSFAYPPPQPVRPTYYRYKPHFEYYKAPIEPVPPSLLPSVVSSGHKPTITTITTTIKTEKPAEQSLNIEEKLNTKPEVHNVIEPISMEELISPITLKELEREGEKRVETRILSTANDNVVSGKISEFDSSWTPIVNPSNTKTYEPEKPKVKTEVRELKIREKFKNIHHHSYEPPPEIERDDEIENHENIEPTSEVFYELTSQRSIPVSNLHIQVDDFTPIKHSQPYRQYEVTENTVEESKQVLQSIKPTKKNQRKVPTTTTTTTTTMKPSKSKYVKTLPKPTSSMHYHQRTISSSISTSTQSSTTSTTSTTTAPTTISTIQTTTEKPNYPEYFLDKTFSDFEKFESNCDDQTTTENPILRKLQVIVRKENLDNDKKYSHIQSVTTANPNLYSKKSETETRKQTSTTEGTLKKKDVTELEAIPSSQTRDQNRESRKSSAIMRNMSKGKSFTTTRVPPQQNHIETTTIYGNRDTRRYLINNNHNNYDGNDDGDDDDDNNDNKIWCNDKLMAYK
ncbi:general transcriptional corepressor trfA-like [Condylostylus longicornis]|uniref:general transcriptional corepressor trfA-like n=1 Tax=Condylostylus longicornis TaxID=2530218 RepID=UPI00244E046D|nr:general transcriptional corepressor trfA-like [Condylostylus longicornis]